MSENEEQAIAVGSIDPETEFKHAEALRQSIPPDFGEAVLHYTRAANCGHAEAQNALGTICLNGLGRAPDPEEAVRWYRKAASQGEPTALYNLATRYRTGEGVTADLTECVALLTLAAERGCTDAIADLGVCFRFGHGVQPDLLQATELFLLAAEDGDVTALANVLDLKDELQLIATADDVRAFKLTERLRVLESIYDC